MKKNTVLTGIVSSIIAVLAYTTQHVNFNVNAQPPAAVGHADAPPEIIASTIADMPLGTQTCVNPEALIIDENKKVWLNKYSPISAESPIVVHYMKDKTFEVEVKDDKIRWLKVPLTDDLKKALVPVKTIHVPKKKQ